MLKQQSAKHRAKRNRGADGSGPGADGATALMRWEDHGDDGKGQRQNGGTADAHHRTEADEHGRGNGERADGRGDGEDRQADHEDLLASDAVTDHSPGEQQRCEHQDVGVDRPDQLARGRLQVMLNRGQGDVEHRVVEHHHQQAHDQHRQNRPAARVPLARRHPRIRLHAGPTVDLFRHVTVAQSCPCETTAPRDLSGQPLSLRARELVP